MHFLVGAERSGTTLLRLMLDHHPEIAWCGESEFFVEYLPDAGFPDTGTYIENLHRDRIFNHWGYSVDPTLNYRALLESFLLQKRRQKKIIGATVHKYFDRLLRIWPDAKFIHIMRDGRDVSLSVVQMGWAGNVWIGADTWIEAERLWKEIQPRLAPNQYINLKYEDLIKDSKETLTRLCRFLGTEFDPAMFKYAEHSTYDLPDRKLVDQWKRKQTPEQVQLVESKIANMLTERGYELSGQQRIQVTSAMEKDLMRHSRKIERKFKIKRYGFFLVAMSKLSRILHINPLENYCRNRVHQITNAHLK
ncbi:MAG TPA: sulfotransferase [Tepidisphaeraceae bacterium]|nr:sulfotransferase [Tepidisphaeraceae bacterium]